MFNSKRVRKLSKFFIVTKLILKFQGLSAGAKIVWSILILLVLFLISFGITLGVLKALGKSISSPLSPLSNLKDTTSEKGGSGTNACPLNGLTFNDDQKEKWEKRRPLGVMVENHLDSRPQSGVSRADVVYEAVAEGGITRFLAMYLCQDAGDITPIRSARTYYVDWLSEYDALYSHVGGANTDGPADALEQVRDYGIRDMDQFGLGFPTYWRGSDRFAPHNVHSTTEKLWEAAEKRNWGPQDEEGNRWDENFVIWKFKDDAPSESRRNPTKPLEVDFWEGPDDYDVTWKYDSTTNTYLRFHGQTAHVDALTNEQIAPKVVVIQFQDESSADDGYPGNVHLLYETIGSGSALMFMDGKVIVGEWQKDSRTTRSKFLNESGDEIELNRGQIWIQIVPTGSKVTY